MNVVNLDSLVSSAVSVVPITNEDRFIDSPLETILSNVVIFDDLLSFYDLRDMKKWFNSFGCCIVVVNFRDQNQKYGVYFSNPRQKILFSLKFSHLFE